MSSSTTLPIIAKSKNPCVLVCDRALTIRLRVVISLLRSWWCNDCCSSLSCVVYMNYYDCSISDVLDVLATVRHRALLKRGRVTGDAFEHRNWHDTITHVDVGSSLSNGFESRESTDLGHVRKHFDSQGLLLHNSDVSTADVMSLDTELDTHPLFYLILDNHFRICRVIGSVLRRSWITDWNLKVSWLAKRFWEWAVTQFFFLFFFSPSVLNLEYRQELRVVEDT